MKTIIISNTTLKTVKVIPNINRPDEYELWINTNDEVIWPEQKVIDSSNDGSLYYGENNGVANYGFIKADDDTKYLWSSRSGIINCYLPKCKHCKEVVINGFASALTLEKIKEILNEYYPDEYSIECDVKDIKEVRYIIKTII